MFKCEWEGSRQQAQNNPGTAAPHDPPACLLLKLLPALALLLVVILVLLILVIFVLVIAADHTSVASSQHSTTQAERPDTWPALHALLATAQPAWLTYPPGTHHPSRLSRPHPHRHLTPQGRTPLRPHCPLHRPHHRSSARPNTARHSEPQVCSMLGAPGCEGRGAAGAPGGSHLQVQE